MSDIDKYRRQVHISETRGVTSILDACRYIVRAKIDHNHHRLEVCVSEVNTARTSALKRSFVLNR